MTAMLSHCRTALNCAQDPFRKLKIGSPFELPEASGACHVHDVPEQLTQVDSRYNHPASRVPMEKYAIFRAALY